MRVFSLPFSSWFRRNVWTFYDCSPREAEEGERECYDISKKEVAIV